MTNNQSKIEQLIAELCPNGVEFKCIWEVTAWDKKFNAVENHKQEKVIKYNYLLANELKNLETENGDIKLLTTNKSELYTTQELAGDRISDGEVVTIPWGGTANVQYYKGKFLTADNRLATSLDTNFLNNKFLYYLMLDRTNEIQSFYRGSGIQHPSMAKVLDMKIPIPPLPIQEKIVDILDTFTQLEAELEAELEARKKQYEYYRDEMLSFGDDVKYLTLGHIGKVSMCKRIFKNQTNTSGDIPFFTIGTFGKEPNVFISSEIYDDYRSKYSYPKKGDILLSASGTIGRRVIYDGEPAYFQDSNIIWLDNDESKVFNSFLYYLYGIIKWDTEGGTIKRLYHKNVTKVRIPVPALKEQERIVSILKKFDALVNDISIGLPAEINARRKQYEYYRGKLLTFKELEK